MFEESQRFFSQYCIGNLWGETCCSVIDGKLQLKHASAAKKSDINKNKNIENARNEGSSWKDYFLSPIMHRRKETAHPVPNRALAQTQPHYCTLRVHPSTSPAPPSAHTEPISQGRCCKWHCGAESLTTGPVIDDWRDNLLRTHQQLTYLGQLDTK